VPAGGRLLRGLEHDGVAGAERCRDHARRDREREVPRRDHGAHPAREVAKRVAFTRELDERPALLEAQDTGRVVLEEVDRLADVRVGLGPRFARLEHRERSQFQAPLAHQAGRPLQDGRARAAVAG